MGSIGLMFNQMEKNKSSKGEKKKSWEQAYKDRDKKLYGDLNLKEFKAEGNKQKAGGKVPKKAMKGSGSKSSGKNYREIFGGTAYDNLVKKQDLEKNKIWAKNRAAKVREKHEKDMAAEKTKAAFDSKTIKDHRADKKSTRDKFRGSGKTDADKLGKIRSLGESRQGIRNIKENKKIAKLAARKGISIEDATKLRGERKQKGKDFWRNFGSQMVRGTQAPPRKGFDANQSETDFRKEEMEKSGRQKEEAQTPEEMERETGEQLTFDSYINKFGLANDPDNKNIQNAGFQQGSFSPKDYIPEWKPSEKSPSQKYFDNWKAKQSPFGKIEDEEDSNPTMAMKKEYLKRKGH